MRRNNTHKGVIVPMVTPLTAALEIDEVSLAGMMKTFVKNSISVFVAGTTGESASTSRKDKLKLTERIVNYREDNIQIYAGISGNCLSETIEDGKTFASMGVDAVVAHLPFYYPVSDNQILNYFEEIANQVECSVIMYNHPVLVGRSIPLDAAEQLSLHPNIAGLKDSERNLERLEQSIRLWKDREDFSYLVGWAAQSAKSLSAGADGIVPSTANLTPGLYRNLYTAAVDGETDKATKYQELTDRISLVYQQNKNISQSIPALKVLMSEYGLCQPYVLPPMEIPGAGEQEELKKRLKEIMGKHEKVE